MISWLLEILFSFSSDILRFIKHSAYDLKKNVEVTSVRSISHFIFIAIFRTVSARLILYHQKENIHLLRQSTECIYEAIETSYEITKVPPNIDKFFLRLS